MNLVQKIQGLGGFKISATHFRIGSKIHISDFYYAKRFFQNGFFSSRIAFIVASKILDHIEKEGLGPSISRDGLTIVGYEMYSELLISLVDKFLRNRLGLSSEKLNHNLYEDFSNLKLCKNNNLLKNIVIVVPIASTFSTAIKIEQQIHKDMAQSKKERPDIIKPHFNVLYIEDELSDPEALSILESSFNWMAKSRPQKTVTVEAIYADEQSSPRPQQYFLTLPSAWYAVESCGLCHAVQETASTDPDPMEFARELPLYETDQTSVTPAVVFDFPKGRNIPTKDLEREYVLDPKIVSYGHQTRNGSHFIYAIDTERFLQDNYDAIKRWLIEKKEDLVAKKRYKETHRIVIVANCHFSNVSFITMVNDFVFGSSANILHYDPSSDFVQNFQIVHGKELSEAHRIFFVDDSLKSGSHFERIQQFVQNATSDRDRKIDGCFLLLNKSQAYTMKNLSSRMSHGARVHAFANLHLHTSLKPYEASPLELERERYSSIIDNSLLDIIKGHFWAQAGKLSEQTVQQIRPAGETKAERHLCMLVATHRIFQYFTQEKSPVISTFEDFLTDVYRKTKFPIGKEPMLDNESHLAYFKVLTQSPFVQFKMLKDKVFGWVLERLLEEIKNTRTSMLIDEFDYQQFNTLKFFVRRAGLLNSNLLISVFFLEFLADIYEDAGIPKLMEAKKSEISKLAISIDEMVARHKGQGNIKSGMFDATAREAEVVQIERWTDQMVRARSHYSKLKYFYVFYIAQVKELTLKNESRYLKVQQNLDILEKRFKHQSREQISPYFAQVLRILKEENAIVVKMFYDHIAGGEGWPGLYHPGAAQDEEHVIDYTNANIIEYIMQSQFSQHHKAQNLDTLFAKIGQPPILENKSLLNYLWTEYFLTFDKAKKISLNLKTGVVMQKLLEMFQELGAGELGAFFVVNDSNGKPFVAYNQSSQGIKEILDERLTDKEGFLYQYIQAKEKILGAEQQLDEILAKYRKPEKIPTRPAKTVVELSRNTNNTWDDMYSVPGGASQLEDLDGDFVPVGYDRIILVRLNKKSKDSPYGRAQGVLGFYYKAPKEREGEVNIDFITYLLLLRSSLSRFIQNHHESDEFRDWQIAEIKQRTSLLTGHGRDMLINIALTRSAIYKNIVSTLLTVQRFLIDKKEERDQLLCDGPSRITEIFRMFYQQPKHVINNDFFKRNIVDLANDVFKFDEIENSETMYEPILELPDKLEFRFDRYLLMMICFELLVNAKKNRWLFLGETVSAGGRKYQMNQIWMSVAISSAEMSLTISNTGPKVLDMAKIRRLKDIKRYDSSSGVEMIANMLETFGLGKLELDQDPLEGDFAKFKATLILKQNPKEDA